MVWDVSKLQAQKALEGSPLVVGLVYFIMLHLSDLGSHCSCGLVQLALLLLGDCAELDWRPPPLAAV